MNKLLEHGVLPRLLELTTWIPRSHRPSEPVPAQAAQAEVQEAQIFQLVPSEKTTRDSAYFMETPKHKILLMMVNDDGYYMVNDG